MLRRGACLAVLAAAVVAMIGGCGSEVGQYVATTLPVKGKVTYKGKPVTSGSVTFEPEDSGREASGGIQSDGTYVLTSFKEGDGAVPGLHRVAVTGKSGNQVIPLKYRNASSSGTQVEVVEGKSEYNIDLQ